MEEQVSKEELDNIKYSALAQPIKLMGQWGNGWSREITYIPAHRWFCVWDHGQLVRQTMFPSTALDTYYNDTRRLG